eukprot:1180043-Prorocentrum_minimum.AAC.4
MAALAKKSQLPKGLGASLQFVIESKVPQAAEKAAWLLLAEVCTHRPDAAEWTFLNAQWERSFDPTEGVDATLLLQTVAAAASRFPAAAAASLADKLLEALRGLVRTHVMAAGTCVNVK